MRIPIEMRNKMLEMIERDPGVTLNAIRAQLSVGVAESTVCRRLKKPGVSLKKSP